MAGRCWLVPSFEESRIWQKCILWLLGVYFGKQYYIFLLYVIWQDYSTGDRNKNYIQPENRGAEHWVMSWEVVHDLCNSPIKSMIALFHTHSPSERTCKKSLFFGYLFISSITGRFWADYSKHKPKSTHRSSFNFLLAGPHCVNNSTQKTIKAIPPFECCENIKIEVEACEISLCILALVTQAMDKPQNKCSVKVCLAKKYFLCSFYTLQIVLSDLCTITSHFSLSWR